MNKMKGIKKILPVVMLTAAMIISPIQVHAVTNEQVEEMLRAWENGDTTMFSSQEDYENFKWAYENGYMNTTENAEGFKEKQAEIEASGDEVVADSPKSSGTTSDNENETVSSETNTSNAEEKVTVSDSSESAEVTLTKGTEEESVQDSQTTQESEEAAPVERNTVDYNNGFNPVILIVVMAVILVVAVTLVVVVLLLSTKRKTENAETVSKEASQNEEEE